MRICAAQFIKANGARKVAVVASFLFPSLAAADPPRVQKVSILERGIYEAEPKGPSGVRGALGPVQRVQAVTLVTSTATIPGRKSVRFGVRYMVVGAPRGAPVDVKLVTAFPNGGIVDSRDGRTHLRSEYTVRSAIGSIGYREFHFDDASEIIPGYWTFEFWVGASKVGEQTFCIYEIHQKHSLPPPTSAVCSVPIAYLGQLSPPRHAESMTR